VIRDLMFAGKRHFREFLQSEEAISSNVLADRLHALVENGLITRQGDPAHAQKAIFSPTEKRLELLQLDVQSELMGRQHEGRGAGPEQQQTLHGSCRRASPAFARALLWATRPAQRAQCAHSTAQPAGPSARSVR